MCGAGGTPAWRYNRLKRGTATAARTAAENTTMNTPVFESRIPSLPLLARGKVRDIYALGDDRLLIVTTDRLSAFDVILPDPIADKGRVLTAVSNFWFKRLAHIVPNHMVDIDPETVVAGRRGTQPSTRPRHRGQAAQAAAHRGGGARLSERFGLERLPAQRRGMRHQAEARSAAGKPAAATHFHPGHQGRGRRARREHRLRPNGAPDRRAAGGAGARSCAASLRRGGGLRTQPRHHHRRHQVRVRPGRRRRALSDRRGAHARLLPLLARRPVSRGQQSALLRQAVRARLPANPGLEQAGTGPSPARRHSRQDQRKVSRGPVAADRAERARASALLLRPTTAQQGSRAGTVLAQN